MISAKSSLLWVRFHRVFLDVGEESRIRDKENFSLSTQADKDKTRTSQELGSSKGRGGKVLRAM